jgi:hypothetical protein
MPDEVAEKPAASLRAVPLDDVRRARGEQKVALPRSKVAGLRAFRRVRSDRLLGVVGLLLVLVGTTLIFTWEKPPPVEKKFGVEWPLTTHVLPDKAGRRLVEGSPSGSTEATTMTVPSLNVTAVTITLTWEDDVGKTAIEGDRLELEVKGPPGTNVSFKRNDTGLRGPTAGNISVTLPLSGIPDIASVAANSEAKARAAVGLRTNHTGTGDWTMTVRLLSAPGEVKNENARADPRLCSVPAETPICKPDGGNDYTLKFRFVTYEVHYKKLF